MEKLIEILNSLSPDTNFETYDAFLDGNLIESMEMVELITMIEETFDITIPPSVMGNPDYFHSAQAIWNLIQKLEDE